MRGFQVELWAGNSMKALRPIATSTGGSTVPGVIRVRLPYQLRPGQIVRALQKSGAVRSQLSAPVVVENNYVTQDYDNARTGLNPYETILMKSNVPKLKLLFTQVVDADTTPHGTEIHAQPLYVQDVMIPERGKHNIVIVATENNRVYAFDANSNRGANTHALWSHSLIGSRERAVTKFGTCEYQWGITSTPVIDRTTNTLYVVGIVDTAPGRQGGQKWRIHALDISTGANKKMKEISAPGFLPLYQLNRADLLLDHGVLYVPFGSHCHDDRPDRTTGFYHGWLMAYDADIPGSATFLNQLGVFNTTENLPDPCGDDDRYGGGIWQAGIGAAADGAGNVYFVTGNGPHKKPKNFGNSVLKVQLLAGTSILNLQDFFTPTNWSKDYCFRKSGWDQDLGSGGAMLLPDRSQQPTHLLLARGKLGTIYLIDRDNMGKDTGRVVQTLQPPCTTSESVNDDHSVCTNQFHGQPAYYRGPNKEFIFYPTNCAPPCVGRGTIQRYELANASLIPPQPGSSGISTDSFVGVPILTISSNGTRSGTGIVWGVPPASTSNRVPGMNLYAYDANDLRRPLFTPIDVGPWPGSEFNPFTVPTVIHGKVYVGATGQLSVFGP